VIGRRALPPTSPGTNSAAAIRREQHLTAAATKRGSGIARWRIEFEDIDGRLERAVRIHRAGPHVPVTEAAGSVQTRKVERHTFIIFFDVRRAVIRATGIDNTTEVRRRLPAEVIALISTKRDPEILAAAAARLVA
jgi:hypothetical protein